MEIRNQFLFGLDGITLFALAFLALYFVEKNISRH